MLQLNRAKLTEIAADNGWVHQSGRLAGTINARAMANAIGVSTSTITRAYDEGAGGFKLLDLLQAHSDSTFDDLLIRVPDEEAVPVPIAA